MLRITNLFHKATWIHHKAQGGVPTQTPSSANLNLNYCNCTNYIQCKENVQSKRLAMYINGRPKEIRNIARFINSSRLVSTNKWSNFIFKPHKGNCVFLCSIKSISVGEELLIDYNLNCVDTIFFPIMGLVSIKFKPITSN